MNRSHLPELDGVRAVSILLVLACHLLPLGPKQMEFNAMAGPMGMSLFFCLSGFLITRFLYEFPSPRIFFGRRIARIFPLLLVYAFLVSGLIAWRWDGFAAIVLFYLNYSSSALSVPAIGHIWSICVEFHFYISIGLTVWLFGKKAFYFVPVVAVMVLAFRINAGAYVNIATHLRIDEILSGSMLALIWLHPNSMLTKGFHYLAARVLWLVLPLWMLSSHPEGGFLNYLRPYFAALLVGATLFMEDGFIRRMLRHPWLGYIAKISYALYIWHPLTILGWLGEGDRWTLYLLKRPITFALTFVLAHTSTHTLERYFTQLVRKSGATTAKTHTGTILKRG